MELSSQEFILLRDYIHKVCGISLYEDKQYLIKHRLEPLVQASGCSTFEEFHNKLSQNSSSLRDQVISAITTNETSFFRDTHPFETFSSSILPTLVSLIKERKGRQVGQRKGAKVRIWCAGTSSGQEPYSLAIVIYEYLKNNLSSEDNVKIEDFGILATDVSSEILSKAILGKYNDIEISRGLSAQKREKYFTKEESIWNITDKIRNMIEFRQINLIEPFTHIGGLDMIFCRNVLIYFEKETKREIVTQFSKCLSPKGFLLIGATENLYGLENHFQSNRIGNTIIYQKV